MKIKPKCLFLLLKMNDFSSKIKDMKCLLNELMKAYCYSIQDLHNLTGLSRSTIRELINNKAKQVSFKTLEKLCNIFHCKLDNLFQLEGNENE